MTALDGLAILLAGFGAGSINAIVGSGSLITFPTLIALGYPPVVANVSNNIGLVPGSVSGIIGYRRELAGQRARVLQLVPASMVGAIAGATILLAAPPGVFKRVVPVLILVALVLVIIGPRLSSWLAARRAQVGAAAPPEEHGTGVTMPLVLLVAVTGIYGGYFGAAQGILLISLLGIFIADHLQRLNAVKNVLAGTVNAVASVVFLIGAEIDWAVVGLVAVGSAVGGQAGAHFGRRLPPTVLRAVIVVVGATAIVRVL